MRAREKKGSDDRALLFENTPTGSTLSGDGIVDIHPCIETLKEEGLASPWVVRTRRRVVACHSWTEPVLVESRWRRLVDRCCSWACSDVVMASDEKRCSCCCCCCCVCCYCGCCCGCCPGGERRKDGRRADDGVRDHSHCFRCGSRYAGDHCCGCGGRHLPPSPPAPTGEVAFHASAAAAGGGRVWRRATSCRDDTLVRYDPSVNRCHDDTCLPCLLHLLFLFLSLFHWKECDADHPCRRPVAAFHGSLCPSMFPHSQTRTVVSISSDPVPPRNPLPNDHFSRIGSTRLSRVSIRFPQVISAFLPDRSHLWCVPALVSCGTHSHARDPYIAKKR